MLLATAGCGATGSAGGITDAGPKITSAVHKSWSAACQKGCSYPTGSNSYAPDPVPADAITDCTALTPPGSATAPLTIIIRTDGSMMCTWNQTAVRFATIDLDPVVKPTDFSACDAAGDNVPGGQCRPLPGGGWQETLHEASIPLSPSGQAATARWRIITPTEAVNVFVEIPEGTDSDALNTARTLGTSGLHMTGIPVPSS